MTIEQIDHTALAVRDLNEALARYEKLFGLSAHHRQVIPDQRVEVAFLPVGTSQLELVQPLDSESGVARFLQRRGEGLHHIGVSVDDIRAELQRLAANGVKLIDSEPRRGVHGLVAFVHPRDTGGLLIELVQNGAILDRH
ncbi:MAG: methylmalonyl-CoA epimerase [Chloroflexota bacterium]